MRDFLAAHGFPHPTLTPVAADWSVREFHRVAEGGRSAILMRWRDGAVADLPRLTALFAARGVRLPQILALDAGESLALLEDLGPRTVAERIDAGEAAEPMLAAAVDLLIRLQQPAAAVDGIPKFDAATAAERAARFCDWYLPAAGHPLPAEARDEFIRQFEAVWAIAEEVPPTLAHYDFHPGNMFSTTNGNVAVIDFQDAVVAPVAFDLACLLQDVRRDYDPALLARLLARYLAAFPQLDPERIDRAIAVAGAQRATQILGNLGRARVEGRLKPRQAGDILRAWDRLERNLAHPVLAGLKPWYEKHAPRESRGIS
jgi:N-acetylmuramate 1-kinase